MKTKKHLFCVIGYPIEHSLSPYLFNWIFQKLDLPYEYIKISLPKDKLPNFIASLTVIPIKGVSVTIPFKQSIIPYIDVIDTDVLNIKSLNTLLIDNDKIFGYNTDWKGFIDPIKDLKDIKSAYILGSGGAARSCIFGLKSIGIKEIWVSSKNINTLKEIQKDFNVKTISWKDRENIVSDILINSTPLGMIGYEGTPPITNLKNYKYVYDLVYNPVKTELLKSAEFSGCKTISGLKMFVSQAVEQLKIWTGNDFDKGVLGEILLKKIREDEDGNRFKHD